MSIVTGTGDEGSTSLADGIRVDKDDCQVDAYGDIDELNSYLGLILTIGYTKETQDILSKVQNELFILGADLSTPYKKDDQKRVNYEHVEALTKNVHNLEDKLEPISYFILPGGSQESAYLHIARTVCRRAERHVVALGKEREINPETIKYLNRLSDLLFLLARWENKVRGLGDVKADF